MSFFSSTVRGGHPRWNQEIHKKFVSCGIGPKKLSSLEFKLVGFSAHSCYHALLLSILVVWSRSQSMLSRILIVWEAFHITFVSLHFFTVIITRTSLNFLKTHWPNSYWRHTFSMEKKVLSWESSWKWIQLHTVEFRCIFQWFRSIVEFV